MIPHFSTYQAEKLIEFRQVEIDKQIRLGLYVKHMAPNPSDGDERTKKQGGLWHKWFGRRRFDTSMK